MKFSLGPFTPNEFDKLIGKTEHNRKALKRRGHLQPLIVPSPQQRADGLWRDNIFLFADAVILTCIDMLIAAGAKRRAIGHAMVALQLEVIARLHDLDDGMPVYLGFAHDAQRWAVLTAPTIGDALKAMSEHFKSAGDADTPKAFSAAALHEAVATVRARAAQHDIELPDRIWPTPDELDVGADLLAAVIAPRTSPVIEQWQAMRHREITREAMQ